MSKEIYWHEAKVTKEMRSGSNQIRPLILWFTGLPSSGKSTLASAVEYRLHNTHNKTYLLDGDNIRHGLNSDLSFTPEDRVENIRRIGEVAKLFVDAGIIVAVAFISPYKKDRDRVRQIVQRGEFVEIYVKTPIDECERRDPKGLYKKARAGAINEFTGVSAPYEEPLDPELVVETKDRSVDDCVEQILDYLRLNHFIASGQSHQARV